MITISRVKEIAIEKGYRILKVLQYGPKTADECSPFGDDSSPLAGMSAIFANTGEAGEPVIIGYLNKNQLAKPGEKRFYSLKDNGDLSFYVWLKKDGFLELGGNQKNLVRFQELEQGLLQQDTQINAELAKIALSVASVGVVYVPGVIQTQITSAKIEEIKCL